ncbi:MAG: hypothetical protein H6744_03860 [Deltaproteobacteria bacterium]|nr:hypothetical protein [Deltaproteobacteria bacterium]
MTSLRRRAVLSILSLVTGGALAACDTGSDARGGLHVSTAALAPCVANENGDFRFPSNADRVVVRATGGHIPDESPVVGVFASDGAGGPEQAVLEDVPAGEDVLIEVVACKGAAPTWGGMTRGVEVLAANENSAAVFLTPVDAAACVGGKDVPADDQRMRSGHAFAATATIGESSYVLGGFGAYNLASLELRATANVDQYMRPQSRFTPLGKLLQARAMATAQHMSDGTLRIIGGVKAVSLIITGDRPPIFPSPDSAPSTGIEIYDPRTGQAFAGPDTTLPALPALASLPDGSVLAVGGIEGSATWSTNVSVFGASGSIQTFALPAGRYGALVLPTDDGHALVYGGTETGDQAGVAAWLDVGASKASALSGAAAGGVPFMAGGQFLGKDAAGWRFLVIGGSDVMNGAGGTEFSTGAATPRALEVTVAPAGDTVSVRDLLAGSSLEPALFRRLAPSVADLGGDGILLRGGLTSLTSDAACPGQKDCLPQSVVRLSRVAAGGTLSLLGAVQTSSVAPFGSRALELADGSWLLAGGVSTLATDVDAIGTGAGLLRFSVDDPGMCALTESSSP